MNILTIIFIIKIISNICYFFILARDYLGMFILTLILIISIINTILLSSDKLMHLLKLSIANWYFSWQEYITPKL